MTSASQLIPEHELFSVHDSSKMQNYSQCRRRFFFQYVLGWQSSEPSIHLEFGTAVHRCMEHLMRDGLTAEAAAAGYSDFLEYYRTKFGPEWDEANSPKTPDNLFRSLPLYISAYIDIDSDITPIYVEQSYAVGIGNNRVMHAKSDCIYERADGKKACMEHKTGSYFNERWETQWRRKIQAGTYNHLLYCLFPQDEVHGVIINGLFIRRAPRTKQNGEPYANEKESEFHRVPVQKTLRQMEAWLSEVNWWIDELEEDYSKLYSHSDSDHVLDCFQPVSEQCSNYYGRTCPYLTICSSWANPLQHLDEIPAGMEVERWDPRIHERSGETVEVGGF